MKSVLAPSSSGRLPAAAALHSPGSMLPQQQQQLPSGSLSGDAARQQRCMRTAGAPRAGVTTGDVIAMLDPATRQPYGVARVLLNTNAARAGGCGAPGCGGGGPPPADGSSCDCWAFVLALLDPSCPGFRRGSCWLEVFKQGEHVGLRSAAAGGRFLQARRRGAGGGRPSSAAGTAGEQETGPVAVPQEAPSPQGRLPGTPAVATIGVPVVLGGAGVTASLSDGLDFETQQQTAAAAVHTQGPSLVEGPSSVAGFAKQLVRTSRLVFYGHNLGVYEQFELLPPGSGDETPSPATQPDGTTSAAGAAEGPLSAPWSTARVQLRSRLLPHVCLEVELVRIGELVAPRRAPSPPRRAVVAADGAAADDECARLSRIEAVILEQWFKFVESEQQARIGVETAFGELVADVQELRTGTTQQIEWLRGQMAHEVARLMRRLGRREATISELKDRMAAKMAWGVAVINRAARARVLRSTLNAWSGHMALLAERRGAAGARAAWLQQFNVRSAVAAWHAAARSSAAQRARGREAKARIGRLRLARVWGAWHRLAHRRRTLLPSLVVGIAGRREAALKGAVLLAWRTAWEDEVCGRLSQGDHLERLRRRRLQRTAFAAFAAAASRRRATRTAAAVAAAAASTGLLRRSLHGWQELCGRRAAAAATALAALGRRHTAVKGQVFAAWAGRAEVRRSREASVVRICRAASNRLLRRVFSAWAGCGGSGPFSGGVAWRGAAAPAGGADWATGLLARRRKSRCLRAAFGAWKADSLDAGRMVSAADSVWRSKLLEAWRAVPKQRRAEEEGLKACLRRKRIAFRAFKSWYWDALDLDVRTMLQAALNPGTIGHQQHVGPAPLAGGGNTTAAAAAAAAAQVAAGDEEAAALLSAAAGLLPGASDGCGWGAAAAHMPNAPQGLVAESMAAAISEAAAAAVNSAGGWGGPARAWSSGSGGGGAAASGLWGSTDVSTAAAGRIGAAGTSEWGSGSGAWAGGGGFPAGGVGAGLGGDHLVQSASRQSASLPPPPAAGSRSFGRSTGGGSSAAAADRSGAGAAGARRGLLRASSSASGSGRVAVGAVAALTAATTAPGGVAAAVPLPRLSRGSSSSGGGGSLTREGSMGGSVLDRLNALSRRLGA